MPPLAQQSPAVDGKEEAANLSQAGSRVKPNDTQPPTQQLETTSPSDEASKVAPQGQKARPVSFASLFRLVIPTMSWEYTYFSNVDSQRRERSASISLVSWQQLLRELDRYVCSLNCNPLYMADCKSPSILATDESPLR